MNERVAKETMEERAANLIGTVTKPKDPMAKVRARVKHDTATIAESKGTSEYCPYKWTNSIDEEDDQGSSWQSEPEGEKPE